MFNLTKNNDYDYNDSGMRDNRRHVCNLIHHSKMKKIITLVAVVTLVAPVALMFISDDLVFCVVGVVYTLVLYIASHNILRPLWRKFRTYFGKYILIK